MTASTNDNRQLQLQELDILCELRRICEKHGLTYYITAGTLLGAVRHKGFIPWDDDIDVAMPLKDIKRLAKICRTELNQDLFYQDHISDKRYPFHFAKIRKNGTVVNDPFLANVNIHKGLYIDIFPLVKCPKKDKPAKIYFKLVEMITYAMIAKQDKDFVCGYTKRSARALFALLKAMPRPLLITLRGLICGAHELFCSGTRLCTVSGSHGYPREAYSADWFADTVELEFEGEEFTCPKGWHELLTGMYGDYMMPPDESGRKGHFK